MKLSHIFGKEQRITASAGVFNDWWVEGTDLSDSGTEVTGRVTGLLWVRDEDRSLLHLGISVRYAGANHHTMRFRARPESNVTDYYLDTFLLLQRKSFAGSGFWAHRHLIGQMLLE